MSKEDQKLILTSPDEVYRLVQTGEWDVNMFKRWLFLCIMSDFYSRR